MGRAELEALLAGMDDAPGDHAGRLRALGVRVGTGHDDDEAPADAPIPVTATPGLDAMLAHMNADQLKVVAKRFYPGANANRVADSKKAVTQALGKPALLDAMVGKLNLLERALLSEVKRRGGVADAWSLITYAALHAFRPVERAGAGSVYKGYVGGAPGMGYLGVMLRDGLLLPAGPDVAQFATVQVYGGAPDIDVLSADPRVLARLPDEPPPAPPPLELELLPGAAPTATHPLGTPLELFDVLHLLAEEGGLHLTQRGTVAKPLLSRLLKRRPRLGGRLERLLNLALGLGLFVVSEGSSKDPLPVDLPRLRALQTAPLAASYSLVVEAYLGTPEPATPDRDWGPRYTGLVSEEVAADALLQTLALLPQAPVAMEAALSALWERALKHVGSSRRWRGEDEPERPAWFTGALLGMFLELGLVGVAELPGASPPAGHGEQAGGVHIMRGDKGYRYRGPSEGDDAYRYAVAPALGLSWFAERRRWRSATPNSEANLGANPWASLGAELEPSPAASPDINPDASLNPEPSLLIQPNFDILVYLDKLSPPAVTALSCADCTRVDAQTASYTVSRSSLYRALEAGLELGTLLKLLQAHSMGVPENVTRSLRDWATRWERLRVREGTTLLEYATPAERDAALRAGGGAQAVAERFLLIPNPLGADRASVLHRYGSAPARTLRFSPEGHFRVEGATDLAGRAVLAQLAIPGPDGTYRLDADAVRAGALTTAARDALAARVRGGLPPHLGALLDIWAGGDAPAVAKVSVFQHASAAALAQHPEIAPHLGARLSETGYLLEPGREEELERVLADLGVPFTRDFKADVKAQAAAGNTMQSGLDTRKMRALIETTIAEGRSLELRYHREKETYDGYGYGKKSRGKLVTEKITPSTVVYSGSTPYLTGETLGGGEHRHLRIGYITGIRVLSSG